ncbi:MAG: bifunctional chorismate mutase/prephenate dehydratase [Eubacteriales bacterium]
MELIDLRKKIDEIDDRLATLFAERMQTVLQVAEYKRKTGTPLVDRSREREIIDRVTSQLPEPQHLHTKILFSTLFDLSRSYQMRQLSGESEIAKMIETALQNTDNMLPSKAVVACQGIEGAYSQIACDKLFSLPSIMYFNRFEGVFQAVEKGLCRYGILPIENSSYGSVVEVYDLMKKYRFHIVKSIKLQINHVLLSKPGCKLSDIKEIYSHEQALGQCSEFLKNIDVKVTVCENTAIAASMVASSPRNDVAAISSGSCAELYQLQVLSNKIQNSDNNYTRFICISKDLEIYPGANKISLMLAIPHRPGALYQVIAKFSALGLNLTKLESRPIPGSDFEFMFYLDMDASVYSPELIDLLGDLSNSPSTFIFLGSYSEI